MKAFSVICIAVFIKATLACVQLKTCSLCVSENCNFVLYTNGSRLCVASLPESDIIISAATTARHCVFVQRLSKFNTKKPAVFKAGTAFQKLQWQSQEHFPNITDRQKLEKVNDNHDVTTQSHFYMKLNTSVDDASSQYLFSNLTKQPNLPNITAIGTGSLSSAFSINFPPNSSYPNAMEQTSKSHNMTGDFNARSSHILAATVNSTNSYPNVTTATPRLLNTKKHVNTGPSYTSTFATYANVTTKQPSMLAHNTSHVTAHQTLSVNQLECNNTRSLVQVQQKITQCRKCSTFPAFSTTSIFDRVKIRDSCANIETNSQKIVRLMCRLDTYRGSNMTQNYPVLITWLQQNQATRFRITYNVILQQHKRCKSTKMPKRIDIPIIFYKNGPGQNSGFLDKFSTAVDCLKKESKKERFTRLLCSLHDATQKIAPSNLLSTEYGWLLVTPSSGYTHLCSVLQYNRYCQKKHAI